MMNRILKRPMFRMGGRSDDGIMSARRGYQEGDQVTGPEYKFSETPIAKAGEGFVAYGPNSGIAAALDFLNVPLNTLGRAFGYNPGFSGTKQMDLLTGGRFSEFTGYDPDKAYFFGVPTSAEKGFTLPSMKEKEKPVNRIPIKTDKKKVPQDPEKELLDIYKENKGVIDEIMGNSDESTKRDLYLQLAKFGAGLAAQPGGDLVGAVGRAAMDPLEGVGQVLAEKRKTEKDIKTLALQKSFDDMKEPEQIKFVKAIQKEYGFDTFAEAYDMVTKSKKSSAQINADNTYYRNKGKELGVSEEGFRREMDRLDDAGLDVLIGELTRPDAALPEDIDDRVNGEYYVRPNGQAVRSVDGKLYELGDPEFTAEIKATKET
jgi:hypothetical protein